MWLALRPHLAPLRKVGLTGQLRPRRCQALWKVQRLDESINAQRRSGQDQRDQAKVNSQDNLYAHKLIFICSNVC